MFDDLIVLSRPVELAEIDAEARRLARDEMNRRHVTEQSSAEFDRMVRRHRERLLDEVLRGQGLDLDQEGSRC